MRSVAATVAVLAGGAALVTAAAGDALGAHPASVMEGRGRIVVGLPDSDDARSISVEVWIDGQNRSCSGHPCTVGQGHAYSLAYNLPAGPHRVEIRQPGQPNQLDQVVHVQSPDRLLDTLQCWHLPVPQDPTLIC